MWTIKDLTSNDREEIVYCLTEVLKAEKGDGNACDSMCYNLDDSDLWICFSTGPQCIMLCLTDKAEIDGFPSGNIYASVHLSIPYVENIINSYCKKEIL